MHGVMEKDEKQIRNRDCQRKLNLTAPLLSTKRPLIVNTGDNMLANSKDYSAGSRVPFSWERVPGQPKDISDEDVDIPPTPKPPPNRWKPPEANAAPDKVDDLFYDHDKGCDGDVDDNVDGEDDHNEEYGRKECLSDTIDIFSLGESVDDGLEPNYRAARDRRSSATLEHMNSDFSSPNFIIQRFLQDAQALAAASVANKRVSFSCYPYSDDHSFSRDICIRSSSHSSPKGCGLGSFFPWRVKPKICSAKTAVCDSIIGGNPKLQD